jgi:NADPH:quinone reductase-like Zn-dependent oxidoreductase
MRAVLLTGYGGPEKTRLTSVDKPSIGAGDLLVRVTGAGLNPLDYKTRKGEVRVILRRRLPFVLGNELSGEVVDAGQDVRDFAVGDRVIGRVEKSRLGGFAEYAAIDASVTAHAPASIPLADAAGLPLAGLTALQALSELQAGPGRHILITGGAGGVGTLAIQIARILGAEITTTASPRGEALVRDLGADHVIDYTTTDLANVETRFDGVFDLMGGKTLNACFGLCKPGGTVLTIAGMPDAHTARHDLGAGWILQLLFDLAARRYRQLAREHGVTYRYMFMRPDGPGLTRLVKWVDAGKLRLIVDSRHPFDDFPKAMAHLESGHAKGKVLLRM